MNQPRPDLPCEARTEVLPLVPVTRRNRSGLAVDKISPLPAPAPDADLGVATNGTRNATCGAMLDPTATAPAANRGIIEAANHGFGGGEAAKNTSPGLTRRPVTAGPYSAASARGRCGVIAEQVAKSHHLQSVRARVDDALTGCPGCRKNTAVGRRQIEPRARARSGAIRAITCPGRHRVPAGSVNIGFLQRLGTSSSMPAAGIGIVRGKDFFISAVSGEPRFWRSGR